MQLKDINVMGCIQQSIEILAKFFPFSAKFLCRYLFLNQVLQKSMTGIPKVNHRLPWFGEWTALLRIREDFICQ